VKVTVTKSRNGAINLEGDADSIASVIDELMQFMMDMKDREASERVGELVARQVVY